MKPSNPPPANAGLLGAHLSIAGGLEQAVQAARTLGCNVLQIFTKNASTWRERTMDETQIQLFKKARHAAGLQMIASHTSYLINLASPDRVKHARSEQALGQELQRSAALGLDAVVLHPGAHMDSGVHRGQNRIAASINRVMEALPATPPRLLLETMAGQGSSLGHTFEQLATILAQVRHQERVGVCLDTCHIFASVAQVCGIVEL